MGSCPGIWGGKGGRGGCAKAAIARGTSDGCAVDAATSIVAGGGAAASSLPLVRIHIPIRYGCSL